MCRSAPGSLTGIGVTFGLRLRHGDGDICGSGELIGYEPPWSVAYRLVAGPHTYVLRLTCVASDDGTRVRIRQADSAVPLAVDLGRLPETHPRQRRRPAAGCEAAADPVKRASPPADPTIRPE